jgi:Uncharacterized conserved protein (DUF2190)
MAYVEPKAPGFSYGLGTISGAGAAGQLVKVAGDNVFAVNDDADGVSFGVLAKPYADGEMCGVYCMGGIYETDQFEGSPTPGAPLACDADTGKLKTLAEGNFVVGQAISLKNGVLRFKLAV